MKVYGKFQHGQSQSKKNCRISTVLHTAQRKGFHANQWYQWTAYSLKECLLWVSTQHMTTTPNGATGNPQKFDSDNLFYLLCPVWKNLLNSAVKFIFKTNQKWQRCCQTTGSNGISRHTKHTEMHRNFTTDLH